MKKEDFVETKPDGELIFRGFIEEFNKMIRENITP